MARATGVGGVFFKARDPGRLREWRERDAPHRVGYTVWGPFREETTYFAPSEKPFMFTFPVDDLDGLLAKLWATGVDVDARIEEYEYGRFGWIVDPEGNRVELWEPAPRGA